MNDIEHHIYPLLFSPVFKDYIWGGRNLEKRLGKQIPDGRVAESWEIAAHEDGTSIVTNGPYSGMSLAAVHDILGLNLIGRNNAWAQDRSKFPLLVKLLDADEKLSVQVHPDDDYALAHEGNELGKSEMWVVLHADEGAAVILGVTSGTTPESFRRAIRDGSLEKHLHVVPVVTGDVICVPSRTVHAILGGNIIAEIQQNSNTTYRVYDWNRTQNGKGRPLHIDKALDVINFESVEPDRAEPELLFEGDGYRRWLLCRNRYFTTERVEFSAGSSYSGMLDGSSLEIWGVLKGAITLNGTSLDAVQFTLLPASLGSYEINTIESASCLRTYVE